MVCYWDWFFYFQYSNSYCELLVFWYIVIGGFVVYYLEIQCYSFVFVYVVQDDVN